MTEVKKANQLFKAAKSGDVGRIRELLAEGAPLEGRDPNRMTPLLLAAQAGNWDAFDALLKAGADVEVQALDACDLLESAAEGGNVEIIRFALGLGHPVEGHWKPRSTAGARMGHMTPLYLATINGHVEAVRLLLEAGADRDVKFDGQTALKSITADIKHPFGEEQEKRVPQLKEIAALLRASPTEAKSAVAASRDDAATDGVAKFAENAKRPEYEQLKASLERQWGKGRPWKPKPDHGVPAEGVVAYKLKGCKRQNTFEAMQAEARAAGFHLVLDEQWTPGDDASLALFPTDDKFAVVAAVGSEGANHNVNTGDVIDWLKQTDELNPFDLVLCGHDFVGGAFRGPIKGVKSLSERVVEICASVLDDVIESPEILSLSMKKGKSFFLWWD
jgi:hypothetical protein